MMKRFATAVALFTLAAIVAPPAHAVNLVSDGFSYANGNLVPNGSWANFSGANVDIQVVSGRATGGGIPNNQNDDQKPFTPQTTSNKTYACFIANIPPIAGAPKAIYFALFKDATANNLVSRVYVVSNPAGGFTFAISNTSTSATVGVTAWPTPLSFNTDYTLVINYDPVNKSSTLWVNPVNELSPSVTDTNPTATAIAVQAFGLRQSNAVATLPSGTFPGTTDWNWSVDNLGVGTTFDDACARPTPTQHSTWGSVKQIYR